MMETQTQEFTTTNAKEVDNKESSRTEIIQRAEIKDSPFIVITTDGKSFGVMGSYRITEDYETKKEVIEELNNMTWNRIVQVMMILNQLKEETNKELTKELNKK